MRHRASSVQRTASDRLKKSQSCRLTTKSVGAFHKRKQYYEPALSMQRDATIPLSLLVSCLIRGVICGTRGKLLRQFRACVRKNCYVGRTLEAWASAHRGKWGHQTPWKNGWKIKKRKHAKKNSFLCLCYILRAIGAGRCRERRYANRIFIQIYFRIHHFEVKFAKFSSPQAARGHWRLTP